MEIGSKNIVEEFKSDLAYYQIIEEVYTGRPARILYRGKLETDQSGIPLDKRGTMLFEYNKRLVEITEQLKPKPTSMLLIGGGVYTLPTYLSSKHPKLNIDIIEPDESLDRVAIKYFNFKPSKRLNVIHTYGLNYLKANSKTYDLIIIDAFSDFEVADEILSMKFAKLAYKSLKPTGYIAANLVTNFKAGSPVNKMYSAYKKRFKFFKVYPATSNLAYSYPRNVIYTTANVPIEFNLKYSPLNFS